MDFNFDDAIPDFNGKDLRAGRLANITIEKKEFVGCAIVSPLNPRQRVVVEHVTLRNCEQRGCAVYGGPILREILVDGLRGPIVLVHGAAYEHVVLRGTLDRVLLTSQFALILKKPEERAAIQQAFDQANAEFYKNVDWALDVSQGEFKDLTLRGLPAELVRRDPETQFVVRRKNLLDGRWRSLPIDKGTQYVLQVLLDRGDESEIFVANKRDREFKKELKQLQFLRAEGIADPG